VHSHELGCTSAILIRNVIRCVQIMDDDDTALDGGADVGPVNLWMHSLFNDVSVSLNEKLSLDKINPSVVFPSSVQTCFGPSMLSRT
jgi:hypothetical protein